MSPRRHLTSLVVLASAFATIVALSACGDDDDDTRPDVVDAEPPPPPASSSDGGDGAAPPDAGPDVVDAGPEPEAPAVGPRDRAGRPFVSLLLVSSANREAYNAASFDAVTPADPGAAPTFGDDFQHALAVLDGLDGVSDWNGGDADAGADAGVYPHPLTNAWISADVIVVDPNLPFAESSYLDVEANGAAHTTCGGRWPGDDALDKTMSYLVKRSLSGIADGVAAPAKPVSLEFPYLAGPF